MYGQRESIAQLTTIVLGYLNDPEKKERFDQWMQERKGGAQPVASVKRAPSPTGACSQS